MQTTLSCTDPRCRCVQHRRSAARAESADELELDVEFEFEISRGSSEYIRWVQSQLNRLIGAALVVDGISGTLTRSAVRSFQQRAGVAADGVVGPVTEAALLRAGATPPPGGAPAATPPAVPAPAPATGPMARLTVPEAEILALLPAFLPYRYGYPIRYPHPLPDNVKVAQGTALLTVCCAFTEGVLAPAWEARHGSALRWDSERHLDMMVRADTPSQKYSPIKAVVEAGMATAVPEGRPPPRWSLAQGWRSYPSGHQFIIVAHHVPSDRVLTLEANTAGSGMDGVGCSGFGALRNMPGQRPPARWWEDPRCPTWTRLRSTYSEGIGLAQLAVTQPSWAGI